MDHNDSSPIIKSGVRHSVQVAQGTKNAKSVRNVVTSDVDAPIEERILSVQEGTMREAAPLQGGPDEERQTARQSSASAEAEAGAAAASAAMPEQDQSRAQSVLAPEAPPASGPAGAGPVLVQHARGEEDAFGAKKQPGADQGVHVQEPSPAALAQHMVPEDAPNLADNRQRIDQVQAEANRIRLDNPAMASENRVQIQGAAPARKQLDVSPASRAPAGAGENATQAAAAPTAAPEAELPPEVAANLAQRSAAPAPSKASDLMARLRAIKSNMSVTETRLTKLNQPEPPKS